MCLFKTGIGVQRQKSKVSTPPCSGLRAPGEECSRQENRSNPHQDAILEREENEAELILKILRELYAPALEVAKAQKIESTEEEQPQVATEKQHKKRRTK